MAYVRSNEAEGRYLQLTVWEKSYSIANNTSLVGWKLESTGGESVYYMIAPTTAIVNNETVYSKGKTEWEDRIFPAAKGSVSGELTVVHDAEGKKTISFSLSTRVYVSSTPLTWTDTLTLTDLPRGASVDSLTCSTAYFDGTLTVKYTPKNAEYYNRCILSLGNTVIKSINLGKKSASQQTQTVSLTDTELATVYSLLPKSTSGTLRASVSSYSGSGYTSQVGSTSYKDIALTVPTSVKPTSQLSVTVQNTNAWISSLGICVQNYTAVSITLTGSPGAGASIASRNITCGGYSTSESSLTVAKITDSGVLNISGKVTDSRSRSTNDTKNVTVYPYNTPSISYIASERGTYNNGWMSDENGDDLRLLFKSVLSLAEQGNTYTAVFNIDGTEVNPVAGLTDEFTSGTDCQVYISGVEKELTHAFTITVTDKVGNAIGASITVPSIVVPMEFNSNGKGVSFGKPSEKEAFECAFPSEFYNGMKLSVNGESSPVSITDIVIEQGTDGMWIYRKWYSGIAECWGTEDYGDISVTTAFGDMYRSQDLSQSYPSGLFTERPDYADISISTNNTALIGIIYRGANTVPHSKDNTGTFNILRPTSATLSAAKLTFKAIGKWK